MLGYLCTEDQLLYSKMAITDKYITTVRFPFSLLQFADALKMNRIYVDHRSNVIHDTSCAKRKQGKMANPKS